MYLRGYYDDGTALGSMHSTEGKIDSIAQSWACSRAVQPSFAERAMDAVRAHLQSRVAERAVPGASVRSRRAGSGLHQGLPARCPQNGGQYTHAAAWVVMASARLGNGDEAAELFHMLNPVNGHDRGAPRALQGRATSSPTTPAGPTPAVPVGRIPGPG